VIVTCYPVTFNAHPSTSNSYKFCHTYPNWLK